VLDGIEQKAGNGGAPTPSPPNHKPPDREVNMAISDNNTRNLPLDERLIIDMYRELLDEDKRELRSRMALLRFKARQSRKTLPDRSPKFEKGQLVTVNNIDIKGVVRIYSSEWMTDESGHSSWYYDVMPNLSKEYGWFAEGLIDIATIAPVSKLPTAAHKPIVQRRRGRLPRSVAVLRR
jgi:hypothetical protein